MMASTSSGEVTAAAAMAEKNNPSNNRESNTGVLMVKKMRRDRGGSTAKERISKMPPCTAGKRSSIYRGVTRHRWTGRYEAHLWDKSTWNPNQNKKGKQVYLGAYDDEEAAARAYDLAALKYWGPGTLINFPVTDYSRDVEEMQNVSREEYLASLRRKSSGFSRGIAKYRALSSGRWEPSLGRITGTEYLQGITYGKGEVAAAESEYPGGFPIERKIDLTGYIKWWGPNKTRPSDVKHSSTEDATNELKSLERGIQPTEPYQMPQLGTSYESQKSKSSANSALKILSRSAAFKNMQDRASKAQETANDNDEKENKSHVSKIDHGKAVQTQIDDAGVERMGSTLGLGGLPLQKSMFPLSTLLTAPLLTNYNTIDPLGDPILWTSLMPVLPIAPSRASEVTKTESSSTYSFFRQEEG
ncbi:AP2-like ethylene-responsive transcription factor At2g41710 [Silene latifolia]|uniref:AP2-like ethylene-responsive transcription factor At2g41710 n=1 Tax=Silene latifolia TaxID=37657 RepID=UPI003D77E188